MQSSSEPSPHSTPPDEVMRGGQHLVLPKRLREVVLNQPWLLPHFDQVLMLSDGCFAAVERDTSSVWDSPRILKNMGVFEGDCKDPYHG